MKTILRKLDIIRRVFIGLSLRIKAFVELGLCKDIRRKNAEYRPDVIVSMTSYGDRVKRCAPYAIYSILKQTVRPEKIILWLDETKWNEDNIPSLLKKCIRLGAEVRFCKDMRSHTKLLPALQNYPEHIVITVDDDLYYSKKLLAEILLAYNSDRSAIHAFKVQYPTYDEKGTLNPHSQWIVSHDIKDHANYDGRKIMALGFGGILYPPHALDNDVFDEEAFRKLCPYADDIWFFAMALKQDTPRKHVSENNVSYYPLDTLYQLFHSNAALQSINVAQGRNDLQMKDVLEYYKLNL